MDLISSLSAGFSNSIKDALGIVFVIVSYGFIDRNWKKNTALIPFLKVLKDLMCSPKERD